MRIYTLFWLAFYLCSCGNPSKEIPEQTEDFCANIHRSDSLPLSSFLSPFQRQLLTSTGVYILEDGGSSLVTRAWLSEHAEHSIDIQYFIFSPDNVGLIACDYLVHAADRGVKVRLLVDDIMVEAGTHEILTLNSHPNIAIRIYNPGINLGKNIVEKIGKLTTDFRSANQRMHNKTFIVDGQAAITGGRNMADEYYDYDHEYNFRDRDVLLLGKTITSLEESFEQFWNHPLSVPVEQLITDNQWNTSDTTRFEHLHQYACNPENFWPQVRNKIIHLHEAFESIQKSGQLIWSDSVTFVSDKPGKNDGQSGLAGGGICTDSLIALIRQAHTSIDIQSPYLITTRESRWLFQEAIQRGVKIRILTNSLASTDNLEAFSGYQRDRQELLATGIEIYEFKPDAEERKQVMTGDLQRKLNFTPIFGLHAKSMVIDNRLTVIGTFNLDPRSANLNTECAVIIRNQSIAQRVAKGMEEEFKPANSWHTTQQFNPDQEASLWKRTKTWSKKIVPKNIL